MSQVRKVVVAGQTLVLPVPVRADKDTVLSAVRDLAPDLWREIEERPVSVRVEGDTAFVVREDAVFG